MKKSELLYLIKEQIQLLEVSFMGANKVKLITPNNYFEDTFAVFDIIDDSEYDDVDSSEKIIESGSRYKIKSGYLYRKSNHWGSMRSVNWTLRNPNNIIPKLLGNVKHGTQLRYEYPICGKVKFKDIKCNSIDGVKFSLKQGNYERWIKSGNMSFNDVISILGEFKIEIPDSIKALKYDILHETIQRQIKESSSNIDLGNILKVEDTKQYLDLLLDWLSGLNLKSGKSPNGMKKEYELMKWVLMQFENAEKYNSDVSISNIKAVFGRMTLEELEKISNKMSVKESQPNELKLRFATYHNNSVMSFKNFKDNSEYIDKFLGTLKGFHEKSLHPELNIYFVKKEQSKAKATYKGEKDVIYIRPDRIERGDKYASFVYVVTHELGHRYLAKNRVNFDYDNSKWITTPYSKSESWNGEEKFAELFALSHFNYTGTPFDSYKTKIEEFNKVMGGARMNESTAEDMLSHETTTNRINNIGGEEYSKDIIDRYLAKSKNYKPNTYYRVEGGSGSGYAGMGNGLYLGRDISALKNFYDIEDEGKPIVEYVGNPKWLDLMDYKAEEEFIKSCKENKIRILNSNEVGDYVKSFGFDGIRYYDPEATGEEFVLFDVSKLRKNKTINKTINKT